MKSNDVGENSHCQRKPTRVADIGSIRQSLVEHFAPIKDPRIERTKKHLWIIILSMMPNREDKLSQYKTFSWKNGDRQSVFYTENICTITLIIN